MAPFLVGKWQWSSVVGKALHNSMLDINNAYATEGWLQEA